MANDLLINAIRDAGLDLNEIADLAGADPRTVQRWLGGRVPHPRYRSKLTAALNLSEQELWPETGRVRGRKGLEEIIGAFPRRDDPEAPDWRALLRTAEQHVDLLGYSLLTIIEARGINKLLAAKAAAGCQIRIAIADPGSPPVIAADGAARPVGRLINRITTARDRFAQLGAHAGIEVREHQAVSPHTILRFDEQMLLTIHLHGTPGVQAPVLHVRREYDYGIFDQLQTHLEKIWDSAAPIEALAVDPKPEPAHTPAKDKLLDQLDYVWRPER